MSCACAESSRRADVARRLQMWPGRWQASRHLAPAVSRVGRRRGSSTHADSATEASQVLHRTYTGATILAMNQGRSNNALKPTRSAPGEWSAALAA